MSQFLCSCADPMCAVMGCVRVRQIVKDYHNPVPPAVPTLPIPTVSPVPSTAGWTCPVCGRGVAPSVRVCPCRDMPGTVIP